MCLFYNREEDRSLLFGEVVIPGKLDSVEEEVQEYSTFQVLLIIFQVEHFAQFPVEITKQML